MRCIGNLTHLPNNLARPVLSPPLLWTHFRFGLPCGVLIRPPARLNATAHWGCDQPSHCFPPLRPAAERGPSPVLCRGPRRPFAARSTQEGSRQRQQERQAGTTSIHGASDATNRPRHIDPLLPKQLAQSTRMVGRLSVRLPVGSAREMTTSSG